MSDTRLSLVGVRKTYETRRGSVEAIREATLYVKTHEILSIIGPSGCGKTTLLHIAAGLLEPSDGSVTVSPNVRHPMMVFQQFERCLFPYMSVERNVSLALISQPLSNVDKRERVHESLRITGLLDCSHMYPFELSGGMQQRVLFSRCLAAEPPCLLLDEPFAAVDAQTRYELEDVLRDLAKSVDAAVVHVTHDIDSAIYCGDRVLVLSARPAHILEEFQVQLGDQRGQQDTRANAEFVRLRSRVYAALKAARHEA